MTMPLSSISSAAVTRSRARMLLLDQAAFLHELLVELFVLLYPFHILAAGGEGRLQGAFVQVILKLFGIENFAQKANIPIHGVFGHLRRSENSPQHIVGDVRAQGFFDRWNSGPVLVRDTLRVEDRE